MTQAMLNPELRKDLLPSAYASRTSSHQNLEKKTGNRYHKPTSNTVQSTKTGIAYRQNQL
jgi:hypothetical protein